MAGWLMICALGVCAEVGALLMIKPLRPFFLSLSSVTVLEPTLVGIFTLFPQKASQ